MTRSTGSTGSIGAAGAIGFDVVIVGGGVAGCVLAARLSEDADRTVCLLEAGPDYGPHPHSWPPKLADARRLPRQDVWEPGAPMHRIRARVLGGSSCINGCWNTWGSAADHQEWARRLGREWSQEAMEPFRLRVVSQMGLRRPPDNELSAFSLAALQAARELGHAEIKDMAAPGADTGYGLPHLNAAHGLRWNASLAYLSRARTRPNLSIVPHATVRRFVIRRGGVEGVEVDVAGDPRVISAGAYVLAAGTLGSPAILLRSGVGPADHLAACGITPRVDLPGVGANLSDQPGVFLPLTPTPDLNAALAAKEAAGDLYGSRMLIRAASEYAPAGGWDLHLLPVAGPPLFGKLPQGEYEAGISAFLMKPASRGRVRLRPEDPDGAAEIEPALLMERVDLAALRDGLRMAEQFADSSAVARLTRRTDGPLPSGLPDDDLRGRAGVYWHPVGTCAAGADDDPDAVVDPLGQVRGVANLRIADASVLPTPPAANTQLPVAAVAEMLAENLRSRG